MIRVQLTIGARSWDIAAGTPQPDPAAAPVVLDGTSISWRYASEDEWPSALEPLQATVMVAAYNAALFDNVNEGDPATVRFLTPAGATVGAVYGQLTEATATSTLRHRVEGNPAATGVLTTWTLSVVDHKGSTFGYQQVKGSCPAGTFYDRWSWLRARTIEKPSWLPAVSASTLLYGTGSPPTPWTYAAVDYAAGASVVSILESWAAEHFSQIENVGGGGAPGKPSVEPYQGEVSVLVPIHPGPAPGADARTVPTMWLMYLDRHLIARRLPATLGVVNGLLSLVGLPNPVDTNPEDVNKYPKPAGHPGTTTRHKVIPAAEVELEGGGWRLDRSRGYNAATVTGDGNVAATRYRADYTPDQANMRQLSTTLTSTDGADQLALHQLIDPPPHPWDREGFVWRPADPEALTHDSWFPDLRADHPRIWGQNEKFATPGCFVEPVVVTGIGPRWNLGARGGTYAGLLQRVTITVSAARYRVDFKLRRALTKPFPEPAPEQTGGYEMRVNDLKADHPTVRLRDGTGPKVDPGFTLYDFRLTRRVTPHA